MTGEEWVSACAGTRRGGLVVVEVIRFVWLPFFLWRDTKGVFIADWGEIRHSLYCCGENEWGAFTIVVWALYGREFGEGAGCAQEG